MRAFIKATVFATGLVGLGFVALLWYFYLTYVDETEGSGSSYGYTIGQSKREAHDVVVDQFSVRDISGIHVIEPFQTFDPTDASFKYVESSDVWTLFPAERDDFLDTIKLHFEDGKLARIHRHRQRFELP